MTVKLFQVFLTQLLLTKVMTSYVQPYSIKQYIAKETPQVQQKPYTSGYKTYYQQNYPGNYYQYQRSEPPPIAPTLPRANPLPETTAIIAPIPKPDLELTNNKCSGTLDAHVLNNLAIALQLLIVNNIINNPLQEPSKLVPPLTETFLELAYPKSSQLNLNGQEIFQMPNSQFLGTSNFGNGGMTKAMMGISPLSNAASLSRGGITLMSPYDAIANSIPLSESVTSAYLAKKDFQSPYAAIIAADNNKDLFSMVDFF